MNKLFFALLTIALLTVAAFSQPGPASKAVSVDDIKKQIDSSPQKKTLNVSFDQKANRSVLATTRFILGRQVKVQDSDTAVNPFSSSQPTWDVSVSTAFESDKLTATASNFAVRFNVYNARFTPEGELKVKVDDQVLTFKPARAGRLNSNVEVSDGVFQMDQTSQSIKQNTGSISDDNKPAYMIFVLSREDLDKILHASKVKFELTSQYNVGMQKEMKGALETMLSVSKLP